MYSGGRQYVAADRRGHTWMDYCSRADSNWYLDSRTYGDSGGHGCFCAAFVGAVVAVYIGIL